MLEIFDFINYLGRRYVCKLYDINDVLCSFKSSNCVPMKPSFKEEGGGTVCILCILNADLET